MQFGERILKRGQLYSLFFDLCWEGELICFGGGSCKKANPSDHTERLMSIRPGLGMAACKEAGKGYQPDGVEASERQKALEKHSGPEELKRQRQPVSKCPSGHGFVFPALLKSEPTFFMVLSDSECLFLGRATFHSWAYD